MPTWSSMYMQNANSPLMEQLIFFHDQTFMILMMITIMVTYMMSMTFMNKLINRYLLESQNIEMVWTLIPAVILMFIALPSLKILYMMDEMNNPILTIKAIGHQWYWTYEYSDMKKIELESYMKPSSTLEKSEFRLMEVDNRIIMPMNKTIRMLVTSSDVIHSWAIPSMGIKIDGTPGRLNQGSINMNRPGLMFGQCSEICGTNHSFMPIVIESVSMNQFLMWMNYN
uniref:cytochrome c oxidase subunit II n=1 Tax=Cyrtorhinus lividipennis TaxID=1032904 RepID=UPI002114C204|nr:cytochrome c oxidase subunit II [Cyrtorhinus lividipennis]USH90818.1 cytochrome c oxidase subunit 2 [Cyrtorhinus lividipennis]